MLNDDNCFLDRVLKGKGERKLGVKFCRNGKKPPSPMSGIKPGTLRISSWSSTTELPGKGMTLSLFLRPFFWKRLFLFTFSVLTIVSFSCIRESYQSKLKNVILTKKVFSRHLASGQLSWKCLPMYYCVVPRPTLLILKKKVYSWFDCERSVAVDLSSTCRPTIASNRKRTSWHLARGCGQSIIV